MKPVKQIPNFFTSLNLLLGILAINETLDSPLGINPAFLILLAAVMDFLDGFFAKLLHARSEFGKQLDSLADLVSFGIAPGFFAYYLLGGGAYINPDSAILGGPLVLKSKYAFIAFIIPLLSAYRLAKFNISKDQEINFKGLPTPANALMFTFIYYMDYSGITQNNRLQHLFDNINYEYITLVCFAFSFLMVTRIRFISLKFKDYSIESNFDKFILLITIFLAIVIFQWNAILFIIPIYIIISIIFHFLLTKAKV